jgi:predicted ATPase
MSISSIKINRLFGYFDHDITLRTKDRITIIHGPNGVGKTTILRLLHDLFSLRLHAIIRVPFDKIVVRFLPKGVLTITRSFADSEKGLPQLRLIYRLGQEKTDHTVKRVKERDFRRRFPISMFERTIDHIERIGPEEWIDRSTGDLLTIEDIFYKYGDLMPEEFRSFMAPVPKKLRELLQDTKVYLIETQRLFTKSAPEPYDPRRRRVEPIERC